MNKVTVLATFVWLAATACLDARDLKAKFPERNTLPQDHPYQKRLRQFMAGLTEKDFKHGVTTEIKAADTADDVEYQYRQHVLTLMPQPLVGTKRGAPAVNAPASLFVLSSIERKDAVYVPPVWPEPLIAFVHWKHPGNVYYQNRALKLRAFVTVCIHMMMLDDQLEHHPERGGSRADWSGNQLILFALPYPGFKDVLPREVQQAYETGLRRMGERILEWGPVGEEPNLDIIATVGLWYISQTLQDPGFTRAAEAYARRRFTDPQSFHPAGYFVDNHGIDMGYQGMSNFFACGTALASDWPFAREAIERCYRLRAHLCLPEPDGSYVGPSHFNSRTSSDAWGDQWEWSGARDAVASLITDEAAYLAKLPSPKDLRDAPNKRAAGFAAQLRENPRDPKGNYVRNEDLDSHPWRWRLWHSFNFPGAVNFGYEHYPAGAYAHRLKLQKEDSPWLKSPFRRDENFVHNFGRAFTVAKQAKYAAVLHTGPVGRPSIDEGHFRFAGPLGFGGGQLSAFWTPAAGTVILGRRGGNSWKKAFDLIQDWRQWPLHAVSGSKYDGKIFTSARIRQPAVTSTKANHHVSVSGIIPVEQLGQAKVLAGRFHFDRSFTLDEDKVSVETRVRSTGQDKLAELYETIPIFLREAQRQPKAAPTEISFQIDGQWHPAGVEYQGQVTAVKLKRFKGAVEIAFEQPQRVKLAPALWEDSYLSRAQCRNVLIDLLGPTSPQVFRERTTKYTIRSVAP